MRSKGGAMFCTRCGTQLESGAAFCTSCGKPVAIEASALAIEGTRERTPEPLAEFGSRLGAYLIDVVVILILMIPALVILGVVIGATDDLECIDAQGELVDGCLPASFYVGALSIPGIPFLYGVISTKLGASVGKRIVGLRIVTRDYQRPGWGRAIVRQLVATIASNWFFALGYLWAIWDDQKQTWHDKAAGTYVVDD